ncbi:FERM domain-containing protein 4A isoform X1 [Hydra vulgaris]|nr:FERM domain-containing protein 4A-like [Hydra vulgaris]
MVLSAETRKCIVHLLDGQKLDIPLQPKLLTSELLDIVGSHFNLKEKEYFGFYYYDIKENRCWMRENKKALDHDFQKINPIVLYFSVRNFVPSVATLKESHTVELFFLQIQKLVFQGELECHSETIFKLAAYVLQATHGDYVSNNIAANDLKNLNVIPIKTQHEYPTPSYCELKIIEHYRNFDGMTRGEAIVNYIGDVERLPMYGNHCYNVKDKDQNSWILGLSHRGVSVFDIQNKSLPQKIFRWSHLENIYYKDKKFSIEYREGPRQHQSMLKLNTFRKSSNHITIQAWYSSTTAQCREIWLMAVSQHQFYLDKKLNQSKHAPKSLRDVAKSLCKSSSSLSSMYSGSIGGYSSSLSDTASFYFSLDGESITSSQMVVAEKDLYYALKARKEFLQELLIEKRELLNELCLREADLTGQLPSDLPESPTHPGMPMRRKMGTSFQFDESLFSNQHDSDEQEYDRLLRDYQIQKQITNAAQRIAMDTSAQKKVRKARKITYQKSLVKLKTMEQQLEYLKRDAAKVTSEAMSRLIKQDENESNGDSLGPIDGESLDSDRNSHLHSRPSRYSMFLATPVVSSANKGLDQMKRRPSPVMSLVSPRYDAVKDCYRKNDFLGEGATRNNSYLSLRKYSDDCLTKKSSRSSSDITAIRHDSADKLNTAQSHTDESFVCGEFENTGMYSIGAVKKMDFSSTYSIPLSKSNPGIAQTRMHASPSTLRRLQMLALSPSHKRVGSLGYMYSQSSLASSSEYSEMSWPDVVPEQTLV